MAKTRGFYDLQHARNYLSDSVIRRAGTPIYIRSVDGTGLRTARLWYVPVDEVPSHPRGKLKAYNITFLDDPELDMNPVPLGMLNFRLGPSRHSYYLSRLPSRSWKIGISTRTLRIDAVTTADTRHQLLVNASCLFSHEFIKTVNGDYPSYEEVEQKLRRAPRSTIAFSRRFAIHNGELFYKARQKAVGEATKKGPDLRDEYRYLTQVLEEDLND